MAAVSVSIFQGACTQVTPYYRALKQRSTACCNNDGLIDNAPANIMQGCMCDSAESSKTKVLFDYEIIFSVRTHFEPIVGSEIFWTNKLSLSKKKKKEKEREAVLIAMRGSWSD